MSVPVHCRLLIGCKLRIGLFTTNNSSFPLSNFGQIWLIKPLSRWSKYKAGSFWTPSLVLEQKHFYTSLPVNLPAITATLRSNGQWYLWCLVTALCVTHQKKDKTNLMYSHLRMKRCQFMENVTHYRHIFPYTREGFASQKLQIITAVCATRRGSILSFVLLNCHHLVNQWECLAPNEYQPGT